MFPCIQGKIKIKIPLLPKEWFSPLITHKHVDPTSHVLVSGSTVLKILWGLADFQLQPDLVLSCQCCSWLCAAMLPMEEDHACLSLCRPCVLINRRTMRGAKYGGCGSGFMPHPRVMWEMHHNQGSYVCMGMVERPHVRIQDMCTCIQVRCTVWWAIRELWVCSGLQPGELQKLYSESSRDTMWESP